jgi:hypothetical protein
MRIRELGRIGKPGLIAAAAILCIAPGIARAADETPSSRSGDAVAAEPPQDAIPGKPYRDAIPGYPGRDAVPGPPESPRRPRSYTGVLIGPLLVGFTEGFLADRHQHARRVQGTDLERMERIYQEAVDSNLGPEYAVAEVPGPGVVRADAILIDHVLDKSDWLSPLVTAFRSAPDVRLVVFLRDSQSDELVDTVGMTLPPRGGRLMRDGPGDYWHYMGRVFDRVATRVRWALEDRASRPPLEDRASRPR